MKVKGNNKNVSTNNIVFLLEFVIRRGEKSLTVSFCISWNILSHNFSHLLFIFQSSRSLQHFGKPLEMNLPKNREVVCGYVFKSDSKMEPQREMFQGLLSETTHPLMKHTNEFPL